MQGSEQFSREHFDFSMPVDAGLYPRPPYHFRGAKLMTFIYETERDAASRLLPAPLELGDTAIAALAIGEISGGALGAYNEAMLMLSCTHGGEPVSYVVWSFVTTDVALAAGREIWGAPKKLAHIDFVELDGERVATIARPADRPLCAVSLRPETPITAPLPPMRTVCLRLLPGVEEGAKPSALELVEVRADSQVKEAWLGPGNCRFTGASAEDPWHRLAIKKMLSCSLMISDFTMGYGRVLQRL